MLEILQIYSIVATAAVCVAYLLAGKPKVNVNNEIKVENGGIEIKNSEGMFESNDVTFASKDLAKLAHKSAESDIIRTANFEPLSDKFSVSMVGENYPTFSKLFSFYQSRSNFSRFSYILEQNHFSVSSHSFSVVNKLQFCSTRILKTKYMAKWDETYLPKVQGLEETLTNLKQIKRYFSPEEYANFVLKIDQGFIAPSQVLLKTYSGTNISLAELKNFVVGDYSSHRLMEITLKSSSDSLRAIIRHTNAFKQNRGAPQLINFCSSDQPIRADQIRGFKAICKHLDSSLMTGEERTFAMKCLNDAEKAYNNGFLKLDKLASILKEIDTETITQHPTILNLPPFNPNSPSSKQLAIKEYGSRLNHIYDDLFKLKNNKTDPQVWVDNLTSFDYLKLSQYSVYNPTNTEIIMKHSDLIMNSPMDLHTYADVVDKVATIILFNRF